MHKLNNNVNKNKLTLSELNNIKKNKNQLSNKVNYSNNLSIRILDN